jgi:hypothetical protein
MENLKLKIKLLNYYFGKINDLIKKSYNSIYIENFGHQNPSQKVLLGIKCYHIILPLSPLFAKKHYVKVHGIHTH